MNTQATMQSLPRISIIIPVCNNAAEIRHAVESVLSQEYPNKELVVVDGGSTDGTLLLLESYAGRITWQSEVDYGIFDAMNRGISMSCGDWLLFLGSDDRLCSGALVQVSAWLKDPVAIYYGNVIKIRRRDVQAGSFSNFRIMRSNIPHQAIFYPAEIARSFPYDLKYPYFADYALNLKLFSKAPFIHIPLTVAEFNDISGVTSRCTDSVFERDKPGLIRDSFGSSYYVAYRILKTFHRCLIIAINGVACASIGLCRPVKSSVKTARFLFSCLPFNLRLLFVRSINTVALTLCRKR